jgi:autotransporter-associated beta strand protein
VRDLHLSSANTMTGPTSVLGGKIVLDNSLALQSSIVTIGSTNGLGFGVSTATIGALAGTGDEDLSGVTLTVGNGNNSGNYSGVMSGTGNLTKMGTGTQTLKHFRGGNLNVTSSKVVIASSGADAATSRFTSSTFSGTGTLDLTNNGAIITGMTRSAVEAQVAIGRGSGNWLGTNITSSTAAASPSNRALGVVDNAEAHYPSFGGLTLGPTDIIVKYTFTGDADVDGDVDTVDFARFMNGFGGNAPSSEEMLAAAVTAEWYNGDFNYSNSVNGADFALFEQGLIAYGQANPGAVTESFRQQVVDFANANNLPTSLPEPSTAAALAGCFLLRRSRRRGSDRARCST